MNLQPFVRQNKTQNQSSLQNQNLRRAKPELASHLERHRSRHIILPPRVVEAAEVKVAEFPEAVAAEVVVLPEVPAPEAQVQKAQAQAQKALDRKAQMVNENNQ